MTTNPVEPSPKTRRVVLHPRTASARRLDRSRIDGGHVRGYVVDTDDVLAYVGQQRRLALATFIPAVVAIGALMILTATWTSLGQAQVWGVNVLWLVLGPVTLFSLLAATIAHERRALRLEQQWIDDRQ
jgi:hypothetical protein